MSFLGEINRNNCFKMKENIKRNKAERKGSIKKIRSCIKIRKIKNGASQMTQGLRAHIDLVEDLSLIPSIHI